MAFQWIFPEGTSDEIVTQSAGIGPVYLNDAFQLEWTPANQQVTILLACDENGGSYFIGNRSYDGSPGLWRLTDTPSDDNPNCHFAYDGPHGNAKLFQYMHTSNPSGSTTWSAAGSSSTAPSSSSSASTSSQTASSTASSAQVTATGSSQSSATRSTIPTSTAPATSTPTNTVGTTTPQNSHTNTTAIGVGVGLGVAFLIGLIAMLLLFYRRHKRRARHGYPAELTSATRYAHVEKDYMYPPAELSGDRAVELSVGNTKHEMESQDKRRLGAVELG